jgi:hypothetical protein
MTFTDNDLERLKNEIFVDHTCIHHGRPLDLGALIARLDAAEECAEALQALGTYPGGYCFCRDGRSSGEFNAFGNAHTGECEDAREALRLAGEGKV